MKRITGAIRATIVLLAIITSTTLFAQQQNGGGEDKIRALKIAFITQKLNLTPTEAEKFWPLFNQYENDLKTLRQNYGLGPGKPEVGADKMLEFEQKKLDLKKKYKPQFEAAIGKEKVDTLYRLEDEFKQKMKELRDERRGGGGPR